MLLLVCIAIVHCIDSYDCFSFYSLYCDIVQNRDLVGFFMEICYKEGIIIFKNNYLVRSFHIILPDLNITPQQLFLFSTLRPKIINSWVIFIFCRQAEALKNNSYRI